MYADLLVGHAGRYQLENLDLANGQLWHLWAVPGRRLGGKSAVLSQDQTSQPGGEDGPAHCRRPDRVEELLTAGGLEQITGRARLHRFEHVALFGARRQNQHPGRNLRSDDRRAHLVASQAWKVEIEHEHIRSGGQGAIHGAGTGVGGCDDIKPGVGQIPGHRIAPHRMVVGHNHPHAGHVGEVRAVVLGRPV